MGERERERVAATDRKVNTRKEETSKKKKRAHERKISSRDSRDTSYYISLLFFSSRAILKLFPHGLKFGRTLRSIRRGGIKGWRECTTNRCT